MPKFYLIVFQTVKKGVTCYIFNKVTLTIGNCINSLYKTLVYTKKKIVWRC